MPSKLTKVSIDHDEIRRWADQRKGQPALVKGTEIIRLDFPGYSGARLEPIDWDRWLELFDSGKLALIFQEKNRAGEQSNFNKLVGRETVNVKTGETKVKPARRRVKQAERGERRRPTAHAA